MAATPGWAVTWTAAQGLRAQLNHRSNARRPTHTDRKVRDRSRGPRSGGVVLPSALIDEHGSVDGAGLTDEPELIVKPKLIRGTEPADEPELTAKPKLIRGTEPADEPEMPEDAGLAARLLLCFGVRHLSIVRGSGAGLELSKGA